MCQTTPEWLLKKDEAATVMPKIKDPSPVKGKGNITTVVVAYRKDCFEHITH